MLRKRSILITVFIILSLLFSLAVSASAATTASNYLDNYSASAQAGTNHKVLISFDVNATRIMNSVGASQIVVQVNNNGVWTGVSTYTGSISNGMLAANNLSNTGSISYFGIAGKQYRARVTVYAGNSTGSDSRTITTNTVTAT
jgi:hypothetical protein